MPKEVVPQLRFLGVMPQAGCVEYRFHIECKDKSVRQIILTIANDFFRQKDLMRQEAPDLCYQKVLMDLAVEKNGTDLPLRRSVTALDIAHYRDHHPTSKTRKEARRSRES